jgi:hypothetical protein
MTGKLPGFLVNLSEDIGLQKAYSSDPDGVMRSHGLGDAERAAMHSGDEGQILGAMGKASGHTLFKIIIKVDPPKEV